MSVRDLIRKYTPQFVLRIFRKQKRKQTRIALQQQKVNGKIWTKSDLKAFFYKAGIQEGDSVLIHSSLSKIGYIENGPKDFVDAILEVVGSTGNVLMPNSPNASFQVDYIQNLKVFDVQNSPSQLGAITEYFRKLPQAIRSEHPTEPVSCIGPDANYFTSSHFGNLTPYNENSPFFKLSAKNGKILYVGVSLDNAGTNLHTLEDVIPNFKFPVYLETVFEVKVKSINGELKEMKTKVHNPVWSKKRQCNGLLPLFESEHVAQKIEIGDAETWIFDANKMLEVMISAYHKNGVTMYTPKGS